MITRKQRGRLIHAALCCLAISLSPVCIFAADSSTWQALVMPDNSLSLMFLKDSQHLFTTGLGGWGPNWSWVGLNSKEKATGDELVLTTPFVVNKKEGEAITIKQRVWKNAGDEISIHYDLSADRDIPLTMLVATVAFEPACQDGAILFKHTDGSEGTVPLKTGGPGSQAESRTLFFRSKSHGTFSAAIDPPLAVDYHNGLRILLAKEMYKAGKKSVTITFKLTGAASLLAKESDMAALSSVVPDESWFPVNAGNDLSPGVIGFQDWLEKPAGSHGRVLMVGDRFEFEDRTPVKFWGVNLSYALSAPEPKQGAYTAARMAKYGVNAVRMHKFTGPNGWEGIGDPQDVTKMKPEGMDRLDKFCQELTKNGVYYGWSHTFGMKVQPGNRDRLLAYDEIKNNLKGSTYALINYAEDCQDLMIEMVVNLLKHKNPYTGRTYAEDPALAFVELQNEDDIFFFTTSGVYEKCPTYAKRLRERYAAWLKDKYRSQDALKAAWGEALKSDETLETQNIALQPNPWFMGSDNLPKQKGGNRQRLLDNAAFFYYVQSAFYSRFAKAIRDTGYKGPLVGSPWQAPSGLPHYYNLKSDHDVGYIDRHNYFGGNLEDTMLTKPGSGYFSAGLQQTEDRPFGLSEWIHVYPSLYSAEGPAILAVYGMGLQGWDASYEFQSAHTGRAFSDITGTFAFGVWNADLPTQIGQYPALARMIMRDDVEEGAVIGIRNVSAKNLAEGTFDFSDKVEQRGDIKEFTGNTPPEALAAGRLLVRFSDEGRPSTFPDMTKYRRDSSIISTTGELMWETGGRGYFTVNTKGTKALVGFAENRRIDLSGYSFNLHSPYASVFLTSLEKKSDLSQTKSALLTAVARNSNSGFAVWSIDNRVLENGKGPVLLEPVKAEVTCDRAVKAVNILDQDGQRTGRTLPVDKNSFKIDSAKEKTIYYEIVFGS